MRNREERRANNKRYMANQRRDPEGNARIRAAAKKCWHGGGAERQREYLDRLKRRDYFAWKARKSYIHLTAEQLRQLWEEQEGLCALTGRPLDDDAQVDHVVPKSRGGDDAYENSRWLCAEANQAKYNLLDDEFLALCREVIGWAERAR